MEKKRAHILISGRVQGVYFRENTRKQASELGLSGWVRNLLDGRVEIAVEGEEEKIQQLISWAKEGPPMARVTDIDIDWKEYQEEFNNFEVKY